MVQALVWTIPHNCSDPMWRTLSKETWFTNFICGTPKVKKRLLLFYHYFISPWFLSTGAYGSTTLVLRWPGGHIWACCKPSKALQFQQASMTTDYLTAEDNQWQPNRPWHKFIHSCCGWKDLPFNCPMYGYKLSRRKMVYQLTILLLVPITQHNVN